MGKGRTYFGSQDQWRRIGKSWNSFNVEVIFNAKKWLIKRGESPLSRASFFKLQRENGLNRDAFKNSRLMPLKWADAKIASVLWYDIFREGIKTSSPK